MRQTHKGKYHVKTELETGVMHLMRESWNGFSSVSSNFSPRRRTQVIGFRVHPSLIWSHLHLITSAMSLFLGKVTFVGTGFRDLNIYFGRLQFNPQKIPCNHFNKCRKSTHSWWKLSQLEIEAVFLSLTKNNCRKPPDNIILNHKTVNAFSLRWGTKQGCPLSLLLFIITLKVPASGMNGWMNANWKRSTNCLFIHNLSV